MTLKQPPPQPPRRTQNHRISHCLRHPTTAPITGFCAGCLSERLAGIENQSASSSIATATSIVHHRRTKSLSGHNPGEQASTDLTEQPRRRSCEVRAQSTLGHLFEVDDVKQTNPRAKLQALDLGLGFGFGFEVKEVEEHEEDDVEEEEDDQRIGNEENVLISKAAQDFTVDYFEDAVELKPIKELIDLECRDQVKKSTGRDFKEIASVLTKKLLKWTHKQKHTKRGTLDPSSNDRRSELGSYGLGRRSCDVDFRLSAGSPSRTSVNDPRFSFEEHRASWDGCLIGKTYPRLSPMHVVNEANEAAEVSPVRLDETLMDPSPGGSAQTRDYYADSFSTPRRRKSLDRSNSVNRAGLLEVDEVKAISNAKVSPETVGMFHGAKLLVTEKELKGSNWYSIKDYQPGRMECMESASKPASNPPHADSSEVSQKGSSSLKKPKKWLNLLNLMQKKSKLVDDKEKSITENAVIQGSLGESLQNLRRNGENKTREKLIQSYTVSARKSCDGGVFHSPIMATERARNSCDGFYNGGEYIEKRKNNIVLQRDRSAARYSPNNIDNGLLRFYLTPLRSSSRKSKHGRSKLKTQIL